MGSTMASLTKAAQTLEQHSDFGVITFIALLNLPTVIKTYLIEDTQVSVPIPIYLILMPIFKRFTLLIGR